MELAKEHNRRVWDERVQQGRLHTRTARDDEFKDPLKAINGRGWISGGLDGKQVLCLAGGGGLQAPLYAAAGAIVTVGMPPSGAGPADAAVAIAAAMIADFTWRTMSYRF